MGHKYKVPETAPGRERLLFPVAWGRGAAWGLGALTGQQ